MPSGSNLDSVLRKFRQYVFDEKFNKIELVATSVKEPTQRLQNSLVDKVDSDGEEDGTHRDDSVDVEVASKKRGVAMFRLRTSGPNLGLV